MVLLFCFTHFRYNFPSIETRPHTVAAVADRQDEIDKFLEIFNGCNGSGAMFMPATTSTW